MWTRVVFQRRQIDTHHIKDEQDDDIEGIPEGREVDPQAKENAKPVFEKMCQAIVGFSVKYIGRGPDTC